MHTTESIVQDLVDAGDDTTAETRVAVICTDCRFQVEVETPAKTVGNTDCLVCVSDRVETDNEVWVTEFSCVFAHVKLEVGTTILVRTTITYISPSSLPSIVMMHLGCPFPVSWHAFTAKIEVKNAYPSSALPLPYNFPSLTTGSHGSVSQPSPYGCLSRCPYKSTVISDSRAAISTIRNGERPDS